MDSFLSGIFTGLYQTKGQFNSGIGIDGQFQNWNWLFKKNWIGLKIEIALIHKLIYHLTFLIQKIFFHDK